jgi:predicted PurR-regulated permease PerM
MTGAELFRALAKAIVLITGVLVALWFVHEVRGVLLFFTLAAVLAIALNAPVTWLERRRRAPRLLATLLVFAAVALVTGVVGVLIVPRLAAEISSLIASLPDLALALSDRIDAWLGNNPELQARLQLDARATQQLVPWLIGALGSAWRYGFSLLVTFVLGLVLFGVVLYMVLDPRPLLHGYLTLLPLRLREPGTRAFVRGSEAVVGWVTSSVVISAMKAVPAYFFLLALGIPGALVWAVFSFIADLVPRIGFYLMIIPPVLVALSVDPLKALWVALFYWGISEFLGDFVAPRIQADAMQLHPVFLLFVTLAMVKAFGLLGAVVSTPVAGFIRAYYEEFYLARQPADPALEGRVEAMLTRRDAAPEAPRDGG